MNTFTDFEAGFSGLPFKLIDVSEISLEDEFLQYEPFYNKAREFKKEMIEALKNYPKKKLYVSIYDPAENKDGTGIVFKKGMKPAVGHSFEWHKKAAEEYMPAYKSRLCTKSEYILFLAYLMKKMSEHGWGIEELWDAVTKNSKKLGQYRVAGVKSMLQPTGSKGLFEFHDLANTIKFIASDDGEADYYIASGAYHNPPDAANVADIAKTYCPNDPYDNAVGKVVFMAE